MALMCYLNNVERVGGYWWIEVLYGGFLQGPKKSAQYAFSSSLSTTRIRHMHSGPEFLHGFDIADSDVIHPEIPATTEIGRRYTSPRMIHLLSILEVNALCIQVILSAED